MVNLRFLPKKHILAGWYILPLVAKYQSAKVCNILKVDQIYIPLHMLFITYFCCCHVPRMPAMFSGRTLATSSSTKGQLRNNCPFASYSQSKCRLGASKIDILSSRQPTHGGLWFPKNEATPIVIIHLSNDGIFPDFFYHPALFGG